MKKVVLTSLLAFACTMSSSGLLAQPQQSGVNMSQDEYKVFGDCQNATQPADKAAKCEAYLKAYPSSAVKADVLNQLVFAYVATQDATKTLDAADRDLAVNPNDLFAYVFETQLRRGAADNQTDAAAKQAGLDDAAGFAQKALALGQPKGIADADFQKVKSAGYPVFYGAIGADDFGKKDYAGAITAFKQEIAGAQPATLTQPSAQLQDMVLMANAYYLLATPDYLNCSWYATRAAAFAGNFAAQIQPTANYCYKKYHGDLTGYDKMQAAVQTSVDPLPQCPPAPPAGTPAPATPPPPCLTVTPAPKPEDIVAQTIASTPDLATLAISDKEFMLQYGTQKDPKTQTKKDDGTLDPASGKTYADEVFDTVKGKATQFPAVTVMDGSTVDTLLVAVTDDAAASKTADFTFKMKESLKEVPATGTKLDLTGVYDSYTQKPLMISMTDGAVVEKKKPAPKTPVRRAPVRH